MYFCVIFHRCTGVFSQASHILLAVYNAGRLCRGHAERCAPRRTSSSAAQKHSTTCDCFSRMVITINNNYSDQLNILCAYYSHICFILLIFRYLVFYTPFDIGYSISKFLPVKLVFSVMKEIYRYVFSLMLLCSFNKCVIFSCKKVHDGVLHAAKLYPNAYIIMVLIGTLKGIKTYLWAYLITLLNNIGHTVY